MKRKRGHKKGKFKKLKTQSPATSPNDDVDSVNTDEIDSGSDVEETSKAEELEQCKTAVVVVDETPIKVVETPPPPVPFPKVYQRPTPTAVYGRVKVKLKTTPKPPPPPPSGPSNDAGKSSEVVGVVDKKKDDVEKAEESSKRSGVIKIIVSSKNSSPPAPGGGKIVSSIKSSPPSSGGKESGVKNVSLIRSSSPASGGLESGGKIASDGLESGKILSSISSSPSGSGDLGSGKIVSLKISSPPGDIDSGKIVSSKSSSALGDKESGKIVNSTSLSPPAPGRLESGKIVSLKNSIPPALGGNGSSKIVTLISSSPPASGGRQSDGSEVFSEEEKTEEHEERLPQREAKYNKQDLESSLEVIKKVMKMEASEPFNVPVDPIGLGIPDYFDVIDTPMDFGTIRSNLESGSKYMNSEDVYKDVQFIWDNCYKYNNKGDFIVDLMKRVKKNFMKYWIAAGLYAEQIKKTKGEESSPLDEPITSGHGKKLKKGKGVKQHKDDCLCAICIMKRRRREREAREAQLARELRGPAASPQIKIPKTGLPEEYKQEEVSHTESPLEISSYIESSPYGDGDADAEMEDGETRPDAVPQYNNEQKSEFDRSDLHDKSDRSGYISEKSVQSDKVDAELYSHYEANVQDESGSRCIINQPEGQTAGYLQHRNELLEMEKKRQKLRMLETFRDLENPKLLGLCGILFPNDVQTVWNGANSLVRCKRSCQSREMHEVVASFMNPPCKSASLK